jgi:predicted N-formylglutamate amidohydrolase
VNALQLLLAVDEPAPFEIFADTTGCSFLFTADHAGRRIPRQLGDLGLSEAELVRHIAWDIGIAGVTRRLAQHFGAFAILQPYSRLVIDCNRPPEVESSIAVLSEYTTVPGNQGLSELERTRRRCEVFEPYHAAIETELTRRSNSGLPSVLIAMHSFTPSYKGVVRPWHAGVLYNRDSRLALALLTELQNEDLVVGNNEPYFVSDESDYAVPRYGEQRGNLHVEIELRQDLIADEVGQARFAAILARALPRALGGLASETAR